MLYEVVGEEVIEVVGQKQDCWMLRMPPSVTVDGTQGRMETYWVDKDTGVPLKLYQEGWALDGSSGFDCEYVLVHTNIDLGPESTQPPGSLKLWERLGCKLATQAGLILVLSQCSCGQALPRHPIRWSRQESTLYCKVSAESQCPCQPNRSPCVL